MSPTILAAALVLSRLHGPVFASLFLLEQKVAFEVIAELLWDKSLGYYPVEESKVAT